MLIKRKSYFKIHFLIKIHFLKRISNSQRYWYPVSLPYCGESAFKLCTSLVIIGNAQGHRSDIAKQGRFQASCSTTFGNSLP